MDFIIREATAPPLIKLFIYSYFFSSSLLHTSSFFLSFTLPSSSRDSNSLAVRVSYMHTRMPCFKEPTADCHTSLGQLLFTT